ncbi:hypothetical protein VZT92_002130 [Zoarces viviparus]|uniref:Uncharacterized protein n=1 Tax=Zoarces viviparus TaxID=48416 RepID=A0AAW1FXM9_ZOAVI
MHPTLRSLFLCHWDLANGRSSVMVWLKTMRLFAVSVQVRQDVQTHHDVLQQLLNLLIALLRRAWRLGQRHRLKAAMEAVAGEKLGVRGGVGARRSLGGVGGSSLNSRGLWVMSWAWLDTGGRRLTEVCLQPFVAGAIL